MKAFLHGGPEDGSEFAVGVCTTPPPFIDVAAPRLGGPAARYTLRVVTVYRPGHDVRREDVSLAYHFDRYVWAERRSGGCAQTR